MGYMVSFSECPECQQTIGTRGLARHREQLHGVRPATKGRKPKALTTATASDLRRAIRDGSIPTDAIAFAQLLKMGFITEDGKVTEAGIARLAPKS